MSFTCISCAIVFQDAADQRIHYRSEHHRYNMKRRVAGLTPISLGVFNQKVLERQSESNNPDSVENNTNTCHLCKKSFSSENTYRSHLNSKKHRDAKPKPSTTRKPNENNNDTSSSSPSNSNTCLFCPFTPDSDTNTDTDVLLLSHMSSSHSFFIPDIEYLDNLQNLLHYLSEKISIGNICIFCHRQFPSTHAVIHHMIDTSHCKIAYETEPDRLEVSDFYDFRPSYPSNNNNKKKKDNDDDGDNDGEWEDVDEQENDDDDDDDDELLPPTTAIPSSIDNTGYELILPSGASLLHKSLHKVYLRALKDNTNANPSSSSSSNKPNIRSILSSQQSGALVPRKGGIGDFGIGAQGVKARNPGEAKEAGRHVKEFRDQARREAFKTKVAFRHNNQKHFRDPLLQ